MGRQIDYWMEFDAFRRLASTALSCGCHIISPFQPHIRYDDIEKLDPHQYLYYFCTPQADPPLTQYFGSSGETTAGSGVSCPVITAGFSCIDDAAKRIARAHLSVITGFYDAGGTWIPRDENTTRVYQRLVKSVKKLCPYTELTDSYFDIRSETYGQQMEYRHKEYISPFCLKLKKEQGYHILSNPLFDET